MNSIKLREPATECHPTQDWMSIIAGQNWWIVPSCLYLISLPGEEGVRRRGIRVGGRSEESDEETADRIVSSGSDAPEVLTATANRIHDC